MPKVISGKGFDEFVQTGKHQTIDDKGKRTPDALPTAKPAQVIKEIEKAEAASAETISPDPVKEESGLEAGDEDLAERAQTRINKKHREMRQAEALAKKLRSELDETENFSKSQYTRAQLAEERAANLERELTDLKAKAPAVAVDVKRVSENDPKYFDEKGQFKAFVYAADLAREAADDAVKADRKAQSDARSEAQQQEAVRAFAARVDKAREKYPDWKDLVGADDRQVPNYIQNFMVKSPYGGDLGYWAATHREESQRLFDSDDPMMVIAELGEIQTQFKKAPEKAEVIPNNVVPIKPSAPAPITPLSGSGSPGVNSDPAKMSPKELLAYTREKEISRKRR
jgi:hypothetical protein